MDGSVTIAAAQPGGPSSRRPGRDWALVVLLLLLVGALRTAVIANTAAVARDGIVFIDYALQFERKPWPEVLRGNHQHPGYPLSVWAVSLPVRLWSGRTDCDTMQVSAQLASALAGVLLVIPMFLLGRELFDRRVGFWSALLFQCLPVSGRVLSDGLSEGLFLLLAATALLLAMRAVRSGSAAGFLECGLCSGLAYLTRPEGALVPVATLLLLLLMQLLPSWRRSWRRTLANGSCVGLASLAVASPYLVVTHHLTNKPTGEKIIRPVPFPGEHARAAESPQASHPAGSLIPSAASFTRRPLAVWLNKELPLAKRLTRGLRAVVSEVVKGFNYIVWLPALLGLWWSRDRFRVHPGAWLLDPLCRSRPGAVPPGGGCQLCVGAPRPVAGAVRHLPRGGGINGAARADCGPAASPPAGGAASGPARR